jgi:hypothetical protein
MHQSYLDFSPFTSVQAFFAHFALTKYVKHNGVYVGSVPGPVIALAVEPEKLLHPGLTYDLSGHTSFGHARLPTNARMPRPSELALVLSASVPVV